MLLMGDAYETWREQLEVAAASLPGVGTPFEGDDPLVPPDVPCGSHDLALRYAVTMIQGLIAAGDHLAHEVDRLHDEIHALSPPRV
jgi:hypothetical protein